MTTLRTILLAILLGINLISCETPQISDEVHMDQTETVSFNDDDLEGTDVD